MKIRYEVDIDDCNECNLFALEDEFSFYYCNLDDVNNCCKLIDTGKCKNFEYCCRCTKSVSPFKKRPCPIEVK